MLFAIIGIIFVICLVYYIARKLMSGDKKKNNVDFPSDDYMKTVGGMCPDYWTVGKQTKNTHECINKFNIPIENINKCYDGENSNKIKFNTVKKWPPKCKTLKGDKGICKWIDNCGPKANIRASWIGMDKACAKCE